MKTALLVVNFGGPTKASEVEPFLFELFSDKDVIPLPGGRYLQALFADRVSAKRAPDTAAQYARIGGGSPLVEMTFKQAEALGDLLAPRFPGLSVHVGMRYTRPFIKEALKAVREEAPERIVVLALYPHFSFATTGSSYNEVARALASLGMEHLPTAFIPAWHDDPDYVAAVAARIREALVALPPAAAPHLLFSAHGLPVSFIERGDPYQRQVQATVRDVVAALGFAGSHSLAYQSRVGPSRWLSPATDDEIRRLAASGARALVVVPLSFVGDHIETLYELDLEYRHVAAQAGITHYLRAPALDLHPRFIRALAAQVEQALARPRLRDCVRCLLPKDEAYHRARACRDCGFKKPAYMGLEAACPDGACVAPERRSEPLAP